LSQTIFEALGPGFALVRPAEQNDPLSSIDLPNLNQWNSVGVHLNI
jgi:hypothetical protein